MQEETMDRITIMSLNKEMLADIRMDDSGPSGIVDQFGLTVRWPCTFSVRSDFQLQIALKDCKISLGSLENPFYVGSCKMQFASQWGTVMLQPQHASTVYINTRLQESDLILIERYRQFQDL